MSRNGYPLVCSNYVAYSICALVLLSTGGVRAEDQVSFYVGGAIGQSAVQASIPGAGDFNEHDFAFKAMAGVRVGVRVGAELDYFDLGHPDSFAVLSPVPGVASMASDVSQRGVAAYGVVYIPMSTFAAFAKAGIGRMQSTLNNVQTQEVFHPGGGTCTIQDPNCGSFEVEQRVEQTDTRFAAGLGVQHARGALAMRAEYEYFSAADRHPTLISLGLTYSF